MVQTSNAGLEIYDNLKIQGTKRWEDDPPLTCPYCSGKDTIYGVEVIAAYDGTLYWECEKCEEKMLRFTKETTVKHLAKTDELHIDLEGLKDIWLEEPN